MSWTARPFVALLVIVTTSACDRDASPDELSVVDQDLVFVAGELRDLSGLAYIADDRYYVVDDRDCLLRTFTIEVDRQSGAIGAVTVGSSVQLDGRDDCEEVVIDPSGTVWVSDEIEPSIIEHDASDGSALGALVVPDIYRDQGRNNYGFESLAIEADRAGFWAANEGALTVDGELSTEQQGMILRLQHWTGEGQPDRQVAYIAEKIPEGTVAIHQLGGIGIVDMVVAAGNRLLVLERSLTGLIGDQYQLYVFEVTVEGATDVSLEPSLVGSVFEPVAKRLLFEATVPHNYETMTLGPMLEDGVQSLVALSEGLGDPPTVLGFRLLATPGM